MSEEPDGNRGVKVDEAEGATAGIPKNWKEAIPCLISSRIAIIKEESKQALRTAIFLLVMIFMAVMLLLLSWLLIVGGLIGVVSESTGWKWYQVSFLAVGLHVLVAMIGLAILKQKLTGVFSVTKAEFQKDVEWLNELKKK